jgi:hypothetical protein
MTVEEAISGISNTVFASLDFSTSVGYPWVLSGHTSKRPWFTDPVLRARLIKEVDVKLSLIKRGFRPTFLHMDVLKDERRTAEKVASCSTRVVVVGPIDLLILNRMYFGGFASWIQVNKITNGITIGMNPYSQEFDDMCQKIFLPLYKVFAGDSKGFDLNQHSVLLRAIFAGINDWYGDPDGNAIRSILALEFMFPRHLTFPTSVSDAVKAELRKIPDSEDPYSVPHHIKILNACIHAGLAFVYEVWSGHPSGSYLTALINSLYSKLKPLIVLLQSVGYDAALEAYYTKKVVSMTLGDDFITAVHPLLTERLNALSFSIFSRSYGMEVTRENKLPITEAFPTDPPIFLKRLMNFSRHFGKYVGSLDQTAIVEAMCWIRKKHPSDKELISLFDGALSEFSLWGPEEYARRAPKVEAAARFTLRSSYKADTWAEAARKISALEASYRP